MGRQAPIDGEKASDLVRGVLAEADWIVEPAGPIDLLARRGSVALAVGIKVLAGSGGAARLIPVWSHAWLKAKEAAPPDHIPVAVVVADRIASRATEALMHFIAEVAPEASAGIIDRTGLRRFRGTHLQDLNATVRRARRSASQGRRAPINLFSDLNQWMLKVLLAQDLPEGMLQAPRGEYHGPSELAKAADVSAMSASRLISQLRSDGFLDESAPNLRLVRRRNLLMRWQSAVAAQPVVEHDWKEVLRGASGSIADRWLAGHGGCLGLFAAATAHHLGFVDGVPPHVYADSGHEGGTDIAAGWVKVGRKELPDLVVRTPSAPESTFRGMVEISGRPVADILQVWLDVVSHPTRGREQADHIRAQVLDTLCGVDNR